MTAERTAHDQEVRDAREEAATIRQRQMIPSGTFMPVDQMQRYQKYGFGPTFKPVEADPGVEPDFQGPLQEGRSRQGHPAGFEALPTEQQQQFDEKQAAAAREAARREEADRVRADYEDKLYRAREENLTRLRDQFTQTHPVDDPTQPEGLKAYLFQLKNRYPKIEGAEKELGTAWENIRKAHPRADPVKAAAALKSMYAQPAGANSLGSLFGVDFDPSQFSTTKEDQQAAARANAPPSSLGTQTINQAELAALAQRMKITPEQAAAQMKARNFVIVP